MSALDRWLFQRIDPTLYGLLRLFFGLSAVCKFVGMTSPLPRLVLGGFDLGLPLHRYKPGNFAPAVIAGDLLPPATYAQYACAEGLALAVAVAVAIGVLSRLSSLLLAVIACWMLVVDPAGFKHNLFAIVCFGFLIAACPCGDRLSVDAAVRRWLRRRLGPPDPTTTATTTATTDGLRSVFPLRLVQVQVSVIYLFSVLVKLNDGWATGHLLAKGIDESVARARALGLGSLEPLLRFRGCYAAASWVTVAVEAFLIVGFLAPRTRGWALFLGVALHTGIDLGVDVGSYSLTMFAAYIAFIDPRPRQLRVVAPRRLARALRALDWLQRLDVVDGDAFVGDPRTIALRLPLSFPIAFVVERFEAFRRRRR